MASTSMNDDFISVSTVSGKAAALDATHRSPISEEQPTSGIKRLWTNKLKGLGSHLAVTKLKNDVMYIAIGGTILAVNAVSGDEIWRQHPETQKWFSSSLHPEMIVPQDEDFIYFSQAGRVVKLNSKDGSIIWDQKVEISVYHVRYNIVTLLDAGSFLIVALPGAVAAFNKIDGKQVWNNDLQGKEIWAVTVALYKNILIAGTRGYLVSINVQTGEKISEFHIKGSGSHVVTLLLDPIHEGRLYLVCWGECRAVTVHDGAFTELWKSELAGMGNSSGHSLFLDHTKDSVKSLIVGMRGKVCALDPENGQCIWMNELKGCGFHFVTLNDFDDNTLLVATHGKLLGLDKKKGEIEWMDELEGLGNTDLVVTTKRQNTDFNSTTLPHHLFYH